MSKPIQTSVPLHLPSAKPVSAALPQLPALIQTPSGLALLELQGTINLPPSPQGTSTPIGRLEFADYNPSDSIVGTAWMKRVYMYVGQHQRLAGEMKKLPRALAVVRRRARSETADDGAMNVDDEDEMKDLEVCEVVKYKLVFSSRPEPVGST